jgi:hypothetical protein
LVRRWPHTHVEGASVGDDAAMIKSGGSILALAGSERMGVVHAGCSAPR